MSDEDNSTGVPEINEDYSSQNDINEELDNDTSQKQRKREGRSMYNALYGVDDTFKLFMLLLAELIWGVVKHTVMIINRFSPIKVSARLTDWVAGGEAMLEGLRQGHDKKLDGKVSEAMEKLEKEEYKNEIKQQFEEGKLSLQLEKKAFFRWNNKTNYTEAGKKGISQEIIDKAIRKEAQLRFTKDIKKGMRGYRNFWWKVPRLTSSVWREFPKGVRAMAKDLKKMAKAGTTNKDFLEKAKARLKQLEKQSKFLTPIQETQKQHSKENTQEMKGGGDITTGQEKSELPKEETVQQEKPVTEETAVQTVKEVTSTEFNFITNDSINTNELSGVETQENTETTTKTRTSQRKPGGS